jgi:hypothetical protein
MGYDELMEAREKRAEKDAAQEAKGKGKRGRKRTSAAVEDDIAKPKTKTTRVTEEPEPEPEPEPATTPAPHGGSQWRGCTSRGVIPCGGCSRSSCAPHCMLL